MRKSFGAGYIYETYAAAPDLSSTRLMKAILELSRQKHFARFVFVGELPLG